MASDEAAGGAEQARSVEINQPAVVYQAEGVLTVRMDLSVERAAGALRERAAAEGVSVVEAAQQIVRALAA
jgi:AmiR/NasT family two-component response regulator